MARKTFEINLDEVLERAQKKCLLEKLEEELYFFSRQVNTNYELKTTLENIAVYTDQKKKIIQEIMPAETSELFWEIMDDLIEAEKMDQLYSVTSRLSAKVAGKQKVMLGEVITAYPLKPGFLQKISKKIKQLGGDGVRLKNFVDANLIGGMVLKFRGGKIIDTSIQQKLEELKNYLKGK